MKDNASNTESEIESVGENDANDTTSSVQVIISNVQIINEETARIRNLLLHMHTSQNDDQIFQKLHEIQHHSTALARSSIEMNVQETDLVYEFSKAVTGLQSVQKLIFQMHEKENTKCEKKNNFPYLDRIPNAYQNVKLMILKRRSFDKDETSVRFFKDGKQVVKELEHDIGDIHQIHQDLHARCQKQRCKIGQSENDITQSIIDICQEVEMTRSGVKNTKDIKDDKQFLISVSFLTFIIVVGIIVIILIFKP